MSTLAATNDVIFLQETHIPASDTSGLGERVRQLLTSGEYQGWRVAESPAANGDSYAGVLIWWNTDTVEMSDITTLVEGRVQRARMRVRDDGTEMIIVNAYVPTRSSTLHPVRNCPGKRTSTASMGG